MNTHRPSWLPEHLYPFQSHTVELGGNQVHYIDEGSGPVLLFLHGNPTWSFLYRNIVKELRTEFRCVALDYPGFGLSKAAPGYGFTPAEHAAIVEQFIRELDLTEIILMGQDYGGSIGLGAAGRNPERFRGFILGNTFAWPPADDPMMERFSKIAGGPIGKFLIQTFNGFVNLAMPRAGGQKKLSKEALKAYRGPFPTRKSRYPTYVFPRELRGSHAFFNEVADNLSHLSHLPLLLTWGEADPALSMERFGHRFEQTFPNHHTVILEGAGHFFQEEVPEQVTAAVRQWWKDKIHT